jgi:DNA-binding GntR family transcriptional regulator/transposase
MDLHPNIVTFIESSCYSLAMGNPAGARRDFVRLEQRRRDAAELLRQGVPQAEVARRIGVHRQSVSRWAQQLQDGGPGALKRAMQAGRKGRLSTEDLNRVKRGLIRGPQVLGYEGDQWTPARVAHLIEEECQVRYKPAQAGRILRQLEWSKEGPTDKSLARREVQIQAVKKPGQLLADKAYNVIRVRILQGVYSFGFVISRRELAAELGMSQVPINEALARLESEYLIENTARVQTRVRIPTPLDIRGFWAVREALEAQSARLFTTSATHKERRALIDAGRQLDRLFDEIMQPEAPNSEEYYRWRCAHMGFHMQIAKCSHMPYLERTIERKQLLFFNWFYDHQLLGVPPVLHEELAIALAERSAAEAEEAMRAHILTRFDQLMLRMEGLLTMDESRVAAITNQFSPKSKKLKPGRAN